MPKAWILPVMVACFANGLLCGAIWADVGAKWADCFRELRALRERPDTLEADRG